MKRLIYAVLLSSFTLFGSAKANAALTYNDLWWIPTESGWGFNIAQQGDALFITFFVYGQDSKPTWFTGQLTKTGQSANGQPVYSGHTYVTSGPWFGAAAFNSSSVTIREAGSITFAPSDATTAVLTYSVDGANVTKTVQRQTLVNENLTGSYSSLWRFTVACPGIGTTSQQVNYNISITHSSGQFQYTRANPANPADSCTATGTWTQQGALGHANGNLTCTDGSTGTFALAEVSTNATGFTSHYSASLKGPLTANQTCTVDGTLTGLRL